MESSTSQEITKIIEAKSVKNSKIKELVLYNALDQLSKRHNGVEGFIDATVSYYVNFFNEIFEKNPSLENESVDSLKMKNFYDLIPENYSKELTKRAEKKRINEKSKVENLAKVDFCKDCQKNDPKCGMTVVMYDQQQTRGADEPMTQYYMCVRCSMKYKIN